VNLEPIARGGFGLCEAPRLDADGAIWFSDVTNGGVFRIAPDAGAIDEVLPRRRGVGGLVLHAGGGVVVTGRDVVRIRPDGTVEEVFAPGDDVEVTGFNDATVDAAGRLLVGALTFRPMAGESPRPGMLLVVAPGWVAVAVDAGIDWPNGIGFAPDGRTAYVSDYAHGRVLATGVDGQGAVSDVVRPFAEAPEGGSADGLAVDIEGGVWIATGQGGGLVRFDADGAISERVDGIAPFVSSLCFGGDDGCDLVVTTAGGPDGGEVLRGRAGIPGVSVPQTVV
jgi:gluconolactonase